MTLVWSALVGIGAWIFAGHFAPDAQAQAWVFGGLIAFNILGYLEGRVKARFIDSAA